MRTVATMEHEQSFHYRGNICRHLRISFNDIYHCHLCHDLVRSHLVDRMLGFLTLRSMFLMILAVKAAVVLHHILVKAAFAAPMSYYEVTDSSMLLNRFSQDMSLIDMQLPMSAFMFIMSEWSPIMYQSQEKLLTIR